MGGEEGGRMDWEKRQEWGNKGDGMEKDKERERGEEKGEWREGVPPDSAARYASNLLDC